MSDIARFTKFLVAECEDTGTTAFVDELLAKAKEQIIAGGGSVGFLQSASGNGKSVTQTSAFTCDEVASACRVALRLYADTAGTREITVLDFSLNQ